MSSSKLPAPGELVCVDCRDKNNRQIRKDGELKMIQWNIERGYKLDKIIDLLRNLDADIISLQEIDIGCERSGSHDTGMKIAQALKLNYVFLCEFEEHHSPIRTPELQGGGVHGNGILSKFDISHIKVIRHQHQPYDWNRDGHLKREPRKGERYTLRCTIEAPTHPLLMYNAHMELFCGILDRVIIFSDILRDARQESSACPHQAILGDFNTLAHSIARLSPNYCRDSLRLGSLGWTESEWVAHHILNFHDSDGPINTRLQRYGLSDHILEHARNPGFFDPYDMYEDVTLINYWGLFQGKLDYVLVRNFSVKSKEIHNHDYSASDHKLLLVNVDTVTNSKDIRVFKHHLSRPRPGILTCTKNVVVVWSILGICLALLFQQLYTVLMSN